jgi:hypothetical protein
MTGLTARRRGLGGPVDGAVVWIHPLCDNFDILSSMSRGFGRGLVS